MEQKSSEKGSKVWYFHYHGYELKEGILISDESFWYDGCEFVSIETYEYGYPSKQEMMKHWVFLSKEEGKNFIISKIKSDILGVKQKEKYLKEKLKELEKEITNG